MNTSDSVTGTGTGTPDADKPEQDFQHLKEGVTDVLGGAREQADAQFSDYRDTAADQIEALAKGAKSFVSELEDKDAIGMSDYLADIAESMTALAGNLRGKSAEQLLHDAADLARSNPTLFIAGSVALGFGLSRFLKAGNSTAANVGKANQSGASGSPAFAVNSGERRPYQSSVSSNTAPSPDRETDLSSPSSDEKKKPSEYVQPSSLGSLTDRGDLS